MMLLIIVVVCYCLVALLQLRAYRGSSRANKAGLVSFCVLICLCHAYLLFHWMLLPTGVHFSLATLFSLICWAVVLGLCVLMLFHAVDILIMGVFPITALSLLLASVFPAGQTAMVVAPIILVHIVISSITYGVLCLASLVAILLALQEYLLRYKLLNRLLRSLPPMQSLERLLFRLILIGWVMLSLVLVTSLYCFSAQFFLRGVLLKVIVTVIAWTVFAALSWGRFFYGWRGNKVIYGTLFGVSLVVLLYFGSAIILGLVQL